MYKIGMTAGKMPGFPGGHSGATAPKPLPLNQGQAWHYSKVKWWISHFKKRERERLRETVMFCLLILPPRLALSEEDCEIVKFRCGY